MAATIAVAKHAGKMPSAPNIQVFFDFTGDGSYPTGGYDFAGVPGGPKGAAAFLQDQGYDKPPPVGMVVFEVPIGDFVVKYNRTTDKIMIFVGSTGLQVAATTDVSGVAVRGKVESC